MSDEQARLRLLETALSALSDPVVVVDTLGTTIFRNEPARQLEERLGDRAVLEGQRRALVQELACRALRGESLAEVGIPVEGTGQAGDLALDLSPLRDDGARLIGVLVTYRKPGDSVSALRESERRYRALFEAEADAVFLIDRQDGGILDANGAASRIYGYSHEELLTMRNTDVSAEPDQTREATRHHSDHIPVRYHRKKDGTVFPVEITATALRLGSDRVHIIAIRDITERLRDEEALRRAHEAEHRRREEAEQRRLVAEALRGILAVLNSNRPHQEILAFIVAEACRLLGTDLGAIYELREGQELIVQASRGLPAGNSSRLPVPVSNGYVTRAVNERKPLAVPDLAAITTSAEPQVDVQLRDYLAELAGTVGALLAVPLVVKDEVYGAITLYYREAHQFTREETDIAVSFADEAALAIENARLRERAEQVAVAAERTRLARDLHDAVTQTLFSASLIADVLPRLHKRNPEEGERRLEELRQLTRGALAEMRMLLLELRPAALAEAPLANLLRQLADATTGRARIPVSVSVGGEPDLPSEVRVAMYRTAQEALNNVVKHSGASEAAVSLDCRGDEVELKVRDDGRGFDVGSVSKDHLGLGIMRERAEGVGARFSIRSVRARGTEVTVTWQASLCSSRRGEEAGE